MKCFVGAVRKASRIVSLGARMSGGGACPEQGNRGQLRFAVDKVGKVVRVVTSCKLKGRETGAMAKRGKASGCPAQGTPSTRGEGTTADVGKSVQNEDEECSTDSNTQPLVEYRVMTPRGRRQVYRSVDRVCYRNPGRVEGI